MLTGSEAESFRRLFTEVEELDEPGCYDDAVSLLKLAGLVGVESVSRVPTAHASAFETCGTRVEAIWILEHLH